VRHHSASVFNARPVPLHDAICPYQRYVSVRRLPVSVPASAITVTAGRDLGDAVLSIHKVTLTTTRAPSGAPIDAQRSALQHDSRWQPRAALVGGYPLFENRRVLPRARFVDDVIEMPPAAALATLRSGKLPSGAAFDARTTALVPPGAALATQAGCSAGRVRWLDDRDGLTRL